MSFFQRLTANGNGEEFRAGTNALRVINAGTFGGGTVKLQEKLSDGTWVDVADTSRAIADTYILEEMQGALLRFNLSGAAAPSLLVEVKGGV